MAMLDHTFLRAQADLEALFVPDATQHRLTENILLPVQTEIILDLQRLRADFDRRASGLRQMASRQYPIGFCREICNGVFGLMLHELKEPRTPGMTALRKFCEQGGLIKRVWGDLRHSYFQNAMQMGSLYVDVANDSVVPTKPKVEILPFDRAEFYPICNYQDYAELAERYWHVRTIPNVYFPQLLPLYPLLLIYSSGRLKLHSPYQSLFFQNLVEAHQLAETFVTRSRWCEQRLSTSEIAVLEKSLQEIPDLVFCKNGLRGDEVNAIFAAARAEALRFDADACQRLINQHQVLDARARVAWEYAAGATTAAV